MEAVGFECDTLHSTLHAEDRNGWRGNLAVAPDWTNQTAVPRMSERHIVYRADWSNSGVSFFYRDAAPLPPFDAEWVLFYTVANLGTCRDSAWPFTKTQMHLKLNLAIGGSWGGQHGVDPALFALQNKMLVDSVFVYRKKRATQEAAACTRYNYIAVMTVDRSFQQIKALLDAPFLGTLLAHFVADARAVNGVTATVAGNYAAADFYSSSTVAAALVFNVSVVDQALSAAQVGAVQDALAQLCASPTAFSFADLLVKNGGGRCASVQFRRETAADVLTFVRGRALPFVSVELPAAGMFVAWDAVAYGFGGQGVGSLDSSVWNENRGHETWLTDKRSAFDGVDVAQRGATGEYVVGYIVPGEFLRYSRIVAPAVPRPGDAPAAAVLRANRTFRFKIDYALGNAQPTSSSVRFVLRDAATGAAQCAVTATALPVTQHWDDYRTVLVDGGCSWASGLEEHVAALEVQFQTHLVLRSISAAVATELVYVQNAPSASPSPAGSTSPMPESGGGNGNEKAGGDNSGAPSATQRTVIIIGGVFVFVCVAAAAVFLWRKRRQGAGGSKTYSTYSRVFDDSRHEVGGSTYGATSAIV